MRGEKGWVLCGRGGEQNKSGRDEYWCVGARRELLFGRLCQICVGVEEGAMVNIQSI